jgi:hypothetical protein
MNDEQIAFTLKHSSPHSMLIVSKANKITELSCPFRVQVLRPIGLYAKHQVLVVSSIKVTKNLITVYIISGLAYHYFHFEIMDIV